MLIICCIRYVKDTILKAIYNLTRADDSAELGCIRYVKDTILKAIYNTTLYFIFFILLYSICQRYNFESNLQLFKSG